MLSSTLQHRFLRHDCVCPGPFRSPRPRLRGGRYEYPFLTFLQYLAEISVVSVETITPEPETDTDLLLRPFEEWLRYHRGIGEQSIRNHSRGVAMLVSALGPDPRSYDAAGIREALLSHYAGVSRGGSAHPGRFHAHVFALSYINRRLFVNSR